MVSASISLTMGWLMHVLGKISNIFMFTYYALLLGEKMVTCDHGKLWGLLYTV